MPNFNPVDNTPPSMIGDGEDEDSCGPDMPGYCTPMAPGHNGQPNMRSTVQAKHKRYKRERAPYTPKT